MRVLTFIHSFEPGGGERVALRLVRQWREGGSDALLFVGRPDGAMRDDVARDLSYIGPPLRPWLVAHWETLWMMVTLPRVVREHRPDVLFCAGNTYVVIAVALKLLLGPACPPIVAKISNDLDRHDQGRVARWCYGLWLRLSGRFLDHVIATELPMAAEVRERLGMACDETTLIRNPVLSRATVARLREELGAARKRRAGRRFVAVGRLVPQKNFALMLDAFAIGAEKKDTLTIVGEGCERPRLAQQAQRLGLGDRITFAGYSADAGAFLGEADALLLSSDYEGVPAVVLEALAANCAVIATECCRSMRALLDNGRLGTIVPTGDTAAFAAAIAQLVPGVQDPVGTLTQCNRFMIETAAPRFLAAMQPLAQSFATVRWAIDMNFPVEDRFA